MRCSGKNVKETWSSLSLATCVAGLYFHDPYSAPRLDAKESWHLCGIYFLSISIHMTSSIKWDQGLFFK
jgi:hypothetical protein